MSVYRNYRRVYLSNTTFLPRSQDLVGAETTGVEDSEAAASGDGILESVGLLSQLAMNLRQGAFEGTK